jgi:hypothetical protein
VLSGASQELILNNDHHMAKKKLWSTMQTQYSLRAKYFLSEEKLTPIG